MQHRLRGALRWVPLAAVIILPSVAGRSHRRDADSFALSGLQKRSYYCWYTVVHAFSALILRRHVGGVSHNGLPEDSDDARRYLAEHDDALAFARSNRALTSAGYRNSASWLRAKLAAGCGA